MAWWFAPPIVAHELNRAFLIAREQEIFDVAFSKALRCRGKEKPKVRGDHTSTKVVETRG
jgi:hypothetical protein